MSTEQPLDVRGFWLSIRRHRTAVLIAMLVGAVLLAAVPVVRPPAWSSTSQVLLPPPPTNDGQQTDRDPQTYVAVATSQSVLSPIVTSMSSSATVRELAGRLTVEARSTDVLAITATGTSARGSERLAQAVAQSLLDYLAETSSTLSNAQQDALDERLTGLTASLKAVNTQLTDATARAEDQAPTSADGRATANAIAQLTAQQARLVQSVDDIRKERSAGLTPAAGSVTDQARVIQEASVADRLPVPVWMAGFAVLGALLGLAVALALSALTRRRRRRLWSRDGLADAIGSPVLASVRSRTPRSVGGWTTLLTSYDAGPVDAWSWRRLLRDHVLDAETLTRSTTGTTTGQRDLEQLRLVGRLPQRHLLVVAFADDPGAVASAAQLASYAASVGVRTRFVAGQGRTVATRLWAAVSRADDQRADLRDGLRADTSPFRDSDDDLVVLLAVVERREPTLELRGSADCVLVAVSPGTSTGEELALLAVSLDDAGCTVDGLLVADADTADRTTGRTTGHTTGRTTDRTTGHTTGRYDGIRPVRDRQPHRRTPRDHTDTRDTDTRDTDNRDTDNRDTDRGDVEDAEHGSLAFAGGPMASVIPVAGRRKRAR